MTAIPTLDELLSYQPAEGPPISYQERLSAISKWKNQLETVGREVAAQGEIPPEMVWTEDARLEADIQRVLPTLRQQAFEDAFATEFPDPAERQAVAQTLAQTAAQNQGRLQPAISMRPDWEEKVARAESVWADPQWDQFQGASGGVGGDLALGGNRLGSLAVRPRGDGFEALVENAAGQKSLRQLPGIEEIRKQARDEFNQYEQQFFAAIDRVEKDPFGSNIDPAAELEYDRRSQDLRTIERAEPSVAARMWAARQLKDDPSFTAAIPGANLDSLADVRAWASQFTARPLLGLVRSFAQAGDALIPGESQIDPSAVDAMTPGALGNRVEATGVNGTQGNVPIADMLSQGVESAATMWGPGALARPATGLALRMLGRAAPAVRAAEELGAVARGVETATAVQQAAPYAGMYTASFGARSGDAEAQAQAAEAAGDQGQADRIRRWSLLASAAGAAVDTAVERIFPEERLVTGGIRATGRRLAMAPVQEGAEEFIAAGINNPIRQAAGQSQENPFDAARAGFFGGMAFSAGGAARGIGQAITARRQAELPPPAPPQDGTSVIVPPAVSPAQPPTAPSPAPAPSPSPAPVAPAAPAPNQEAPAPRTLADVAVRAGRMTPAEETVPELPETLVEQRARVVAGLQPAMLVPGVESLPPDLAPQEGEPLVVVPTQDGLMITRTENAETAANLAAEGRTGDALGYGVPRRPEQPTAAVVLRNAQGIEVQAAEVDESTRTQVVAAFQDRAQPGDSITVEPREFVAAQRNGMAPAGPAPQAFQNPDPAPGLLLPPQNNTRGAVPNVAMPQHAAEAVQRIEQTMPGLVDPAKLIIAQSGATFIATGGLQTLPNLQRVGPGIDEAEGYYDPATGLSVVFLDQVTPRDGETPAAAVARVIIHERVGHAGFFAMAGDPDFARRWKALAQQIPAAELAELREMGYVDLTRQELEWEWFARRAEQEGATQMSGLVSRMMAAVRAWLDKVMRPISRRAATNADVRELIRLARQAAQAQASAREAPTEDTGNITVTPEAAAAPKSKGVQGSRFESSMPKGKERVAGQYVVIESSDLITSFDPGFPKELQPRDRSRAASKQQISEIAINLDPERLGDSPTVDVGAPNIDDNEAVLSGNGRVTAIRANYESGGTEYKSWIIQNAGRFGFNPADIAAMERPVLVRRVSDYGKLSKEEFAVQANQSQVLSMSKGEKAKADASILLANTDLFAKFRPSEDGNVLVSTNREFIAGFVQETGATDLLASDGSWTPDLGIRIQNAVLATMLDGDNIIIQNLIEDPSGYGLKKVSSALLLNAPNLLKLFGTDYSISQPLTQAIRDFISVKNAGQKVEDFLDQSMLFADLQRTAVSDILLTKLFNAKSQKELNEFLSGYVEAAANAVEDQRSGGLFGDEPRTIQQIVADLTSNERPPAKPQQDLTFGKPGAVDAKPANGNRPKAEAAAPTPAEPADGGVSGGGRGLQARRAERPRRGLMFSLPPRAVQGYLDFHAVPVEKIAANAADVESLKAVVATEKFDAEKWKAAREKAERAWQGLVEGEAALLPEALAALDQGPVSSLMHGLLLREIPAWNVRGAVVESPADVLALTQAVRSPFVESLKVLVVGDDGAVVGSRIVTVGLLDETSAHPRELFAALESILDGHSGKIRGWIISHNHPSGIPTPSNADRRFTLLLENASEAYGIPLLDHVVTNGTSYFSFRESGLIKDFSAELDARVGEMPYRDKPEWQKLIQPRKADWEVVDMGSRKLIKPDTLRALALNATSTDPEHHHIVYLSTQHQVAAIERIKTTRSGDIVKAAIRGVGREGAKRVALILGGVEPSGFIQHQNNRLVKGVRDGLESANIQLVDASQRGIDQTWAEYGLLEQGPAVPPLAEGEAPLASLGGTRIRHQTGQPFRVNDLATRALLTGSPLPRVLVESVEATERSRQAVQQSAAQIGQEMAVAAERVAARTRIPLADVYRRISEVLDGAAGAVATLRAIDPTLAEYARRARHMVDDLSEAIANTLPTGSMRDGILQNLGTWMRRGYAAFDPESGWNYDNLVAAAARNQQIGGQPAATILRDARNFLRSQEPTATPEEIEATMRDLMDRDSVGMALSGNSAVRKNVTSLIRRREIAPEIRALMGEQDNPIHRFAQSTSFQSQFLARHEGQRTIRTIGLANNLFRTQRGGVFTAQFPEGEAWAPLHGLWTTPQMLAAMSAADGGVMAGTDFWGLAGRTLTWLAHRAKMNRVALNPDSWVVNAFGNLFAVSASGDVFYGSFVRQVRQAWRVHRSGAAGKVEATNIAAQALLDSQREMAARLVATGVIGNTLSLADLEATIPRAMMKWIERDAAANRLMGAGEGAWIGQSLGRGFGLPGRAAGAAVGAAVGVAVGQRRISDWNARIANLFLQAPDLLGRLTGFMGNYEAALASGLRGNDAFNWAAERTRNTFPDYGKLPAVVRDLSRIGVLGSFVAFQFEVYRNFIWNIRYIGQELGSKNPALQRRGLARLAGMGAVSAFAFGGLGKALGLLSGVPDDDERARAFRRQFAAPWERGAQLEFVKYDRNGVQYFNPSYLLPPGTMAELVVAARSGEDPADVAARMVQQALQQFAGGSVNLSPVVAAVSGYDSAGRQLSYRPGVAGAVERIDAAAKVMLDPGYADKVERLTYASRGAERKGRSFSWTEEGARLAGVRAFSRTWPQLVENRLREFANQYQNIRSQANKDVGINLPGASRTAIDEANQRLAKLKSEVERFRSDVGLLGVPPEVVRKGFKDSALPTQIRPIELDPRERNRVRTVGSR